MLNPYDLIPTEFGYVFYTDYGAEYYIYFYKNDNYFTKTPEMSGLVYDFVFGKNTEATIKRSDTRVSDTVIYTILDLIKKDSTAVICYFCDSSDGLELARTKLFKKWYDDSLSLVLERIAFNSESIGIHGAILFGIESPIKSFVKEAFFKEFT